MKKKKEFEPLLPCCTLTPALLVKLASIAVHVEEAISADGHAFDEEALRGLLQDAEVKVWLASIPKVLLPLKRTE